MTCEPSCVVPSAVDTLPPGPRAPKLLQAFRYTRGFTDLTADQHRRHGASWTLRLPGLEDAVVTSDRELIKAVLTGDPLTRRHANDILARVLGTGSVMLLEPTPHLARRKQLLPPFHGERIAGYRDVMAELVAADLDAWPDDQPVRELERARMLTLEVIQRIVLGSSDDVWVRSKRAVPWRRRPSGWA